jgi:hypothetical protein
VDLLVLKVTPKPTALLIDDNVVNLRVLEMYCFIVASEVSHTAA